MQLRATSAARERPGEEQWNAVACLFALSVVLFVGAPSRCCVVGFPMAVSDRFRFMELPLNPEMLLCFTHLTPRDSRSHLTAPGGSRRQPAG